MKTTPHGTTLVLLATVGLLAMIVSDQVDGWSSRVAMMVWIMALMLFCIRLEKWRKERVVARGRREKNMRGEQN